MPNPTNVNSALIDETYVRQLARALDLEFASAHIEGVVIYFRMIAEFAAAVNEFALDESIESAPIFIPCLPPTPE